jgi:hypothetical protein
VLLKLKQRRIWREEFETLDKARAAIGAPSTATTTAPTKARTTEPRARPPRPGTITTTSQPQRPNRQRPRGHANSSHAGRRPRGSHASAVGDAETSDLAHVRTVDVPIRRATDSRPGVDRPQLRTDGVGHGRAPEVAGEARTSARSPSRNSSGSPCSQVSRSSPSHVRATGAYSSKSSRRRGSSVGARSSWSARSCGRQRRASAFPATPGQPSSRTRSMTSAG